MKESETAAQFDVVIVGAGMVGASLACALAETGLRIAVLDSQAIEVRDVSSDSFDPRVSAITAASQAFFRSLGVWDAIMARRASPYTDMHVWEADGTGSIHFSATAIHADVLGHIVENSVILAALHERLMRYDNVTLLSPVTLSALRSPVAVTDAGTQGLVQLSLADDRHLSTSLLVAADGANSRVRELAGFNTREWDYEHHAIVTTVRTELPHQQTAIQRFMDEGTLAFLPLCQDGGAEPNDQHYCSIVWSVLPDYAHSLMALDDRHFAQALQGAIENRLGDIADVDKRYSFPLRQRHAAGYVQNGIALIGDAAHTIHPLAGQGVNLGLLDASALAKEISQAHAVGRSFADQRTLRRYQRRRIGHNLGMMWMMEGFKQLFADQPLPLRWLRNAGMTALDRTAPLKNRIMRSAMGIE
ncbi:MAG: FAD-dependent monooxygenase [Gammaproteobacteria bacterium]|nr:FAD-dependent monooxygenase [Gammaproteobacteria bacterium]